MRRPARFKSNILPLPAAFRKFLLRLLLCFILLSAAYLAIFGWPVHHKTLTPSAKIADLRTNLDQTYIAGSAVANFSESSPVAYSDLQQLFLNLSNADTRLQNNLKAAPVQVTASQRQRVQQVISLQQQLASNFKAAGSVLSHVASYDPSSDIGTLSVDQAMSTINSRAQAAANGINKAIKDQTSLDLSNNSNSGLGVQSVVANGLVSDVTRSKLTAVADCFDQLVQQSAAGQKVAVTNTRTTCIANYAAVRQQAMQNIVQASLGASYQQSIKLIPPLLKQFSVL